MKQKNKAKITYVWIKQATSSSRLLVFSPPSFTLSSLVLQKPS
jgi:hypothetical protein